MIKIGKDISKFSSYSYKPTNKEELKEIINSRFDEEGPNCDLNDIDVSLVTDMSWLFACTDFTGDISEWDVSHVTDMSWMFNGSKFNGDISKWDVSKVESMVYMFNYSKFNKDISRWKINKKCATYDIFLNCPIKEEHRPKALR